MQRAPVRHLAVCAVALLLCGIACTSRSTVSELGTGSAPSAARGPIDEYFGSVGFNPVNDTTMIGILENRRRQEVITACMSERGFEYTPVPSRAESEFADSPELERMSDDWIRIYGYGISTLRFRQELLPDGLLGKSDDDRPAGEDPNLMHLASLSPSEAGAYEAALYGDPLSGGIFEPREPGDQLDSGQMREAILNGNGCDSRALREVSRGPYGEFHFEMFAELDEMRARISADQRVIDFESEIARCVSLRGFTYRSAADFGAEHWQTLSSLGFGDTIESERDESAAILRQLQTEEVAMATAALECGGGPTAERNALAHVYHEYEAAFVEEHRGALEQFRNG